MKKEEVIDRIKKLLALSNSSNENEAKAAADMAAKLLAKYDIEMMEIHSQDKEDDLIQTLLVNMYTDGKYVWEGSFAVGIAEIFDVTLYRTKSIESPSGCALRFFGTSHDLEMCIYFFKFLRMRINKEIEVHGLTGKQMQYSFAIGMCSTLLRRLTMMYEKKKEYMQEAGGTDLVIYKKDLAEKAMHNFLGPVKLIKRRTSVSKIDRDAYSRGEVSGEKVSLSHPIKYSGATPGQIR